MSARPKSISIKQLSGAVESAVANLKVKPEPDAGPWFYIRPGIICGLLYEGSAIEAQALAAAIAKGVSAEAGVTLTPVVEEAGALETAQAAAIPGRPVLLGYKHQLQVHF